MSEVHFSFLLIRTCLIWLLIVKGVWNCYILFPQVAICIFPWWNIVFRVSLQKDLIFFIIYFSFCCAHLTSCKTWVPFLLACVAYTDLFYNGYLKFLEEIPWTKFTMWLHLFNLSGKSTWESNSLDHPHTYLYTYTHAHIQIPVTLAQSVRGKYEDLLEIKRHLQ